MNILKKLAVPALVAGLALEGKAAEWDNSFDLGATLTTGNSESLLVTLGYIGEKIEKADEYRLNLFYTYGEDADTATNDEVLGGASWRHLYSERFYVGARGNFRRDDIADIAYRTSFSATTGYYLVKEKNTSLAFEAGLGYTFEEVGGLDNDFAHIYLGEFFEHSLNEKTKIYQSITAILPVDEPGDFQLVAELGLETSLSGALSLKIAAQDKYDADPASGSDKNDFRLITGVSYKF